MTSSCTASLCVALQKCPIIANVTVIIFFKGGDVPEPKDQAEGEVPADIQQNFDQCAKCVCVCLFF